MLNAFPSLLVAALAFFKKRSKLAAEILALCHQLGGLPGVNGKRTAVEQAQAGLVSTQMNRIGAHDEAVRRLPRVGKQGQGGNRDDIGVPGGKIEKTADGRLDISRDIIFSRRPCQECFKRSGPLGQVVVGRAVQ